METPIDKSKTALVVIDLQKGTAARPLQPHDAKTVIANAAKLADAFRRNNMPVFLVKVTAPLTDKDRLNPIIDGDNPWANRKFEAGWDDLVPELGTDERDVVIAKKQWGAFYGTDLDLQLRRRKIETIVLCGIATNFGVESTARFAFEFGYQQIFAEDACATWSATDHEYVMKTIFARMGRVRPTQELLSSLK